MTNRLSWIIPLSALALGACHEAEPATAPPPQAAAPRLPPGHPAVDPSMAPAGGLPAGHPAVDPSMAPPAAASLPLKWTDPPGWTRQTPSSSMRKAQYQIPKAPSDTEPGELTVFYFGAGQGGDMESNINRWLAEFTGADGAPAKAPKPEKRTVGTLPVTIVTTEGTYDGGMMMPGAPAAGPRKDWALLAAIAETPTGPWFFKLTGPKATVAAARPGFDTFVSSMHVE